ncbi:MAG: CPXCG motif-containing cysteine-rich protein [Candidatus Azotimanducaceae bacterium]|uniref:CPXCG motif-containing cysteine-rich protein n=1 Tax=OM182 bacterium TaxID=2510334 RepID=A0A520RY00_9GAMM|nr:hypothetical protein [Gammaproteobacteria bacterium]RZO75126.1 MAG: CPXCG motif-containing cysteine-rich protein [OM182 bacterium]
MNELLERKVQCPYCGELLVVLIDPSIQNQEYVEDCQVCCRPILFDVSIIIEGQDWDGDIDITVSQENG